MYDRCSNASTPERARSNCSEEEKKIAYSVNKLRIYNLQKNFDISVFNKDNSAPEMQLQSHVDVWEMQQNNTGWLILTMRQMKLFAFDGVWPY